MTHLGVARTEHIRAHLNELLVIGDLRVAPKMH